MSCIVPSPCHIVALASEDLWVAQLTPSKSGRDHGRSYEGEASRTGPIPAGLLGVKKKQYRLRANGNMVVDDRPQCSRPRHLPSSELGIRSLPGTELD